MQNIQSTNRAAQRIPFFLTSSTSGFPSPADDIENHSFNLNTQLIDHPAATFLIRVEGNAMAESNVYPGDILIVDKSLTPTTNTLVVIIQNGEFKLTHYKPHLVDADHTEIWGVVTYTIHSAIKRKIGQRHATSNYQ